MSITIVPNAYEGFTIVPDASNNFLIVSDASDSFTFSLMDSIILEGEIYDEDQVAHS